MKIGIFLVALGTSFSTFALQNSAGTHAGGAADTLHSAAPTAIGPDAPYTFKSAYLGMSLEEFKRLTAGEPVKRGAPPNILGMSRTKLVPTPFCTDSMRRFEGDPLDRLVEGEVVCNPSPEGSNRELATVGGWRMNQIIYSFFNGKLYKISLWIPSATFNDLLSSFIQKYGHPKKLAPESYQNTYGAVWQGDNFRWDRGSQAVILNQNDGHEDSRGEIRNLTLGPPLAPDKPLDF